MKGAVVIFPMSAAALVAMIMGVVHAQQLAPAAPAVQANRAPHPAPEQPLPFSHKTHVSMGLECQTCHTNPAPGNQMTFPGTSTCMSCHATIATDRSAIKKLTEYANSNQSISWVRVYTVLPGVTWTHRTHLQAGVQCQTCHGAVGDLPVMAQMTAVTGMASCVSCHEAQRASTACTTCHAWPSE
jgi:Cytochrome c7 and related cytochrome c/Cytochrome c3